MKTIIILALTTILLLGCISDGNLKVKNRAYRPVETDDGWEIEELDESIVNPGEFNQIVSDIFAEV